MSQTSENEQGKESTLITFADGVLTLGDVVKVVCLGKDKMGRVSFSIKDCKQ